ncbi:MAG: F0F1 ATP synthase subunit B [Bacteroidales bacterium]|nr:F0F1 ATP synthase subunit B [Bacteroidota bacterium]MBL6950628.1 F0F1 ATP synthase subunit B [Bacteroidales bacterium]
MELITPAIGQIFWMTLAFLALLFLLRKFAWKPILKSLKDREALIHDALHAADKAKEEMRQLQFSNEELLRQAKDERDAILNDARKVRDSIIEESKEKAKEEAARIITSAKESIENEKMAAMTDLKNQLAEMSLEIATKILEHELADAKRQEAFVKQQLAKINFN